MGYFDLQYDLRVPYAEKHYLAYMPILPGKFDRMGLKNPQANVI